MRLLKFILLFIALGTAIPLSAQLNSNLSHFKDSIIIAKGDQQFAPFEFINEEGQPDGFSVDLFRAVMKRLGIKYTLSLEDWDKVQKELNNKEIDLAIGMIYSRERAEKVKFGIPHCMISYNIICRKDNDFLNLDSLKGKSIIVQNNDRAHVYIKETSLTDNIIVVENIADGIKLLASGQHDAVLSFDVSSFYFVRQKNYKNLIVHLTDIEPERYSIVVNTDNEELLYLLNATIYQMKIDGEYDKIYYKWFGIYEQTKINKIVWYALIILGIFLIALVIFIRILRIKVNESTRDLQVKNQETLKLVNELKEENQRRVATEINLINAKEKAEESDRLKSAFLANMSHEIRTPLNAIVGFSSIICDIKEADERMKIHETIEKNNELLLQLINDILDLSKIEAGTMILNYSDFVVDELCEQVLTSAETTVGRKNIRLTKDIQCNCVLHGDRSRIVQVITNFLTNALKFTKEGDITLRTRQIGDNQVEIAVIDTGIGIEKSKLPTVFERFVKLNTFSQGTGLGLSICKNIVEKLGGEIGAESEVNKGSIFWIRIPFIQLIK